MVRKVKKCLKISLKLYLSSNAFFMRSTETDARHMLMIKCFFADTMVQIRISLSGVQHNDRDLQGAYRSLLRLQFTYRLRASAMANGIVMIIQIWKITHAFIINSSLKVTHTLI
jgi:hypothetical protein